MLRLLPISSDTPGIEACGSIQNVFNVWTSLHSSMFAVRTCDRMGGPTLVQYVLEDFILWNITCSFSHIAYGQSGSSLSWSLSIKVMIAAEALLVLSSEGLCIAIGYMA